MKRALIIGAVFLLGVVVVTYPTLSNYIVEKNGSYIINTYEEQLKQTDEAAIEAAWEAAVAYNETLSGSPAHDPFLEGSGMAMQDNYYDVLNLSDVMAYVDIPVIDVHLPIYHGTSDQVLSQGVGHLEGSSLPIGGVDTHAVLTGHTGLSGAKLFTDLRELQEGDLFYIHVLDQVLAYEVDAITVVEPNETENLKREIGKDYVTLLTCTPYGVNSHRLLVRGTRTEYVPETAEEITPKTTMTQADRAVMLAAGITSLVMVLLIFVALVWRTWYIKRKQRVEAIRRAWMDS